MLKYGEMVPITASILVISNILAVQACLNDTKCINCQPYQIQINLTMNPSYLCQKCVDNSYLNPLSLTCQCQNGYFSFDQATCSPCSNLCKSCTSSYSC